MNEPKDRRAHERVPYQEFAQLQEMSSKRSDAIKPSKFIQIAAENNHLYALDELGKIWLYDQINKEWDRLSDIRKGQ